MEQDFRNRVTHYINLFCWVPLFLGTIGYSLEDLSFIDSLYYSITLYFVSPPDPDINNWLIWIAKFSAVIVTANAIITIFTTALKTTSNLITNRFENSTAIYSDNELGEIIKNQFKHSYLVNLESANTEQNKKLVSGAKRHVFIFNEDIDTLKTYNQFRPYIKKGKAFLLLNQVDSNLLNGRNFDLDKNGKIDEKDNLTIMNVQELLARCFWNSKSIELLNSTLERVEKFSKDPDNPEAKIRIAICGDNDIQRAIIHYAYLNNLFDVNQQFEYTIYTNSPYYIDTLSNNLFSELHKKIGSKDTLIIKQSDFKEDAASLTEMDYIILCEENSALDTITKILNSCKGKLPNIAYYCCSPDRLIDMFQSDSIEPFGNPNVFLSETSIVKDELYSIAKLVNYDYNLKYEWDTQQENPFVYSDNDTKEQSRTKALLEREKYKESHQEDIPNLLDNAEKEWQKLTFLKTKKYNKLIGPFTQGSNIARADHCPIEYLLLEKFNINNESPEHPSKKHIELMELEHIRWCRYHLINKWDVGEATDKDAKLHKDLVPFDDLTGQEQIKDGIMTPAIDREIRKIITSSSTYPFELEIE